MKFEKLTELIDERITGEWGQEPTSSSVKVIRTTNFTNDGRLDLSNVVERNIEEKKIAKKSLQKGDIIIEKSGGGPTQPVGRVVYFDEDSDEKYLCNNFTTILRPKNNLVHSKYLLYQMLYLHKSGRTKRYQNKTTGIHNLNLEKYLQEKIALPELSDQFHIANLLSKAENLISQRKASIRLLDEFLKSTFLEMFGDPVKNEKRWEKDKVISCTDCIVPGRDKPKSFTGYIPWFTTEDLIHKGYVTKSKKSLGLSIEEIKEVRARVIPAGSVLITCVGDLGIISVCKEDCVVNQQLHAFICKEEINNLFLMYSLSFQINFMYKKATSTTVPYMNKTTCNSIPVIIPPYSLQNQFAQIVEKTEDLKAKYQQNLQEMENLYGSLCQRAFRGEFRKNGLHN